MRARSLNLEWSDLPLDLEHLRPRMLSVLTAWLGTKYRSGQRCRGVDADCIGFGCGAIDDMDGRPRAQNPILPNDAALHDPAKAREAISTIRRLYDPAEEIVRVTKEEKIQAQPFDILVVASGAGGPGHMMIVGPVPETLWHCTQGSGVNWTGWKLFTGFERVYALYRLSDRNTWAP